MRLRSMIAALAGVLTFAAVAAAQAPEEAQPKAPAASPQAQAPVTPAPVGALTKPDLDTWLDGFVPYALASGDIAGAVVAVVKDGQVLTEKGYGYADVKAKKAVDPRVTEFRPGSISKTFVWTALMQLVEQGKVSLDADVNTYIDFRVPPRDGKPITVRDVMTHTTGFEEHPKRLFVANMGRLQTLGDYLKARVPKRIFPPGEVPAYSNYGAAMAGYIVERVSGEPFDDYIDRHVFAPLGMTHSSFRQPLPESMAANMSKGYIRASLPPEPFELVNARPAGSATVTGDDMTHFMLAHLQDGEYNGARILKPATAGLMHAPQKALTPPLNSMALGFYHEDQNGHVIIGHAGDTELFHSDLHLLLNDHVGLFISLNSAGKQGASHTIRAALLRGFMDRYYPALPSDLPTMASAKADAKTMAGLYWTSRRMDSSFFRFFNLLSQAKVAAKADGTLTVSDYKSLSGAPKLWREVGPFVWEDASGESRMAAVVRDGKVVNFTSDDLPPVMVMMPVPGWAKASWNLPLLYITLGVLLVTAALWPIQVLVRRRYGQGFALSGRRALMFRLTRATAIADLLGLGTYFLMVNTMSRATKMDDSINVWLRTAQFFCLLGVIGALAAIWNVALVWRDGTASWWAKVSSTAIMLACLAFVWFVLAFHLITSSVQF